MSLGDWILFKTLIETLRSQKNPLFGTVQQTNVGQMNDAADTNKASLQRPLLYGDGDEQQVLPPLPVAPSCEPSPSKTTSGSVRSSLIRRNRHASKSSKQLLADNAVSDLLLCHIQMFLLARFTHSPTKLIAATYRSNFASSPHSNLALLSHLVNAEESISLV